MAKGAFASRSLKKARRILDDLEETSIVSDLIFLENLNSWHVKFKLKLILDNNITAFPSETDWHLLIQDQEEYAAIKISPDRLNGLKTTYEHQFFNVETTDDWTSGYPCLEDFGYSLRQDSFSAQPVIIDERLKWYVERLIDWCKRASQNALSKDGDNFELPMFYLNPTGILVINESVEDFSNTWNTNKEMFGSALLNFSMNKFFLINILNIKGEFIRNCVEPKRLVPMTNEVALEVPGVWIKLNKVPVYENWSVVKTWKELNKISSDEGINLSLLIDKIYPSLKKSLPIPFLVAFPISKLKGGEKALMHIQAFVLPPPKVLAKTIRKEFGKQNKVKALMSGLENITLDWMTTENWNWKESSGRGQLKHICNKKVLLVGAGALGGFLAEAFVRGGVSEITIVDNDILRFGNLTRHLLDASSVGKYKSQEVANYLRKININVKVNFFNLSFEDFIRTESVAGYDLIADASASDSVLNQISKLGKINFFSTAIGFKAENLFLIFSQAEEVVLENIYSVFRATIDLEKIKAEKEGFPTEGIGCWHPVFPADISDIMLAASLSLKWLEGMYNKNENRIAVIPISKII
ncbi:MAG: ThiF family adenylyltransferase [Bacteriovorax sp.]|nr:ThiF family adenylyltransferase [Bacteriovorax sp.]